MTPEPLTTGRIGAAHDLAVATLAVGSGSALAAVLEPGYLRTIPVPVTAELLQRGRERYGIFCAGCHGGAGRGDGPVVQYGFPAPPSFQRDGARSLPGHPAREASVGYYFHVITAGQNAMPAFAARIPPRDRWAIIAHLRTLPGARVSGLLEPHERRAGGVLP